MPDDDLDPREVVLPHNLEAEQSVLGALLQDGEVLAEVADFLAPEDFYGENNKHVYRGALNLFRKGEPVDHVTVAAELEKAGVLDRVGGLAKLLLLQEEAPTALNITAYARLVHGCAQRRRVIGAGKVILKLGHEDALDPDEAVEKAQAEVYAIDSGPVTGGLEAAEDLVGPAMERVDRLRENPGLIGIPSGFHDLDQMTNGYQPGRFYTIAGRPGMGKTSLLCEQATEAAIRCAAPVAVFSLEMSREEILERMLCQEAGVDHQRVQKGMINDNEYDRLARAAGILGDAPIYIDDNPRLDELNLVLQLRRAKHHGIRLVIIDYLQQMQTRVEEKNPIARVTTISRALKAAARELQLPVLAISALSRATEQRPDKRPIMSDLRESGSIEQDSDAVLFVYRDNYYHPESEKGDIAEIIVGKNRHGPTGTIELLFRKGMMRFENIDRRRGQNEAESA